MSFILIAAPLIGVSFGAGYFYATSKVPPDAPKPPPLPKELIEEIHCGIPLKNLPSNAIDTITTFDREKLMEDIKKHRSLKKVERPPHSFSSDCELLKSMRSRISNIRAVCEDETDW